MKREIDFVKFNPTQNMTILVKTNHPADEYTHIASKMMSYDSVYAEQVGFIELPQNHEADAHLQMAAGEFCGNACMALAAYIAFEKGLKHNGLAEITLEASGSDHLLTCQVKRIQDKYYCQVPMPLPVKIEQRSIKFDGDELELVFVRYQQCIHIVMEVEQLDNVAKDRAQNLAKLLGVVLEVNLVGILLYKSDTNDLAPLIYVPSLDSMVWERGCGSGTASIGAYLVWKHKEAIEVQIKQPGGTIHVAADCNKGEISYLQIEGLVGIVAQGKAFIDIGDIHDIREKEISMALGGRG